MTRYGKRKLHIQPPVKIATPYGGRLVKLFEIWLHLTPPLPPSDLDSAGGNKNCLPLEGQGQDQTQEKVKALKTFRARKLLRWSQIMYMYYFLGHQLMDNPSLTDAQKEVGQLIALTWVRRNGLRDVL